MDQSNNVKMAPTKAPQAKDTEALTTKSNALSPLERYLGLIKTMAIVMAVLILAALVTIGVTIYNRLYTSDVVKTIQDNELAIPAGSRVSSASLSEKGQILLVLEGLSGQQLWQVDSHGRVQRKTLIVPIP